MSVKRKFNIDDNSEKCVIITDSNSIDPYDNDRNIVFSVRKN